MNVRITPRQALVAALVVVITGCLALQALVLMSRTPADPPTVAVAFDSAAGAPDAPTLTLWSDAAGVPAVLTLAVAARESGRNLDPDLTGRAGEIGRFQIRPTTARALCPAQNIGTSRGNLACFLRIMRVRYARCGGDWRCAVARYNGSGPAAARYADQVLTVVTRWVGVAMR